MSTTKPETEVFDVEISAPIRRVWEEVTALNLLRRFYMNTVAKGELRPGGKLAYTSRNGKLTFLVGEILEVTPMTRFVHTFRFTRLDDPPTRVTWSLAETGSGTRLTVKHELLETAPKTAKMVKGGWPFILGNLRSQIERGRLPLSTPLKYALMRVVFLFVPGRERWRSERCTAP
jgi:uncharacterized protein YndB with AHSA1/START domain